MESFQAVNPAYISHGWLSGPAPGVMAVSSSLTSRRWLVLNQLWEIARFPIWGGGVKIYLNEHFGFLLDLKWTPTYVKSDPSGYWCDPYWGCYTTSDADYVNQWKFGGTLLARF